MLAGCAIFLAACAAQPATPVRMSQPGDENLSCDALKQQIAENSAAAQKFMENDRQVSNGNIAKGVGGAIPALGLLLIASTDLSNKDQIEGRALVDRDERLTNLSKQKNCVN